MESIDNMAESNIEAIKRDNLSESGKKKLTFEIVSGAVTLCCLCGGLIYTYLLGNKYPVVPELLYFIGFLIEGIPVIYTGVKGLFTKRLTNAMEILVGIAILACAFNKDLILALLIPFILNFVHLLEERSIVGGRDIIEGLKKMQQTTAVLLEDGEEKIVDVTLLKVGQRIVVRPGAGFPVDGVIVSGQTHIDQKSLTGEPEPAFAKTGDPVYAGTVNLEGRIEVEVEKEYIDTSFSNILKLLQKSEEISVPEAGMMDKFLGYYIPFVLGLALTVAILTKDVTKLVAILVVSCPCGQMLVSSAPMIASLSVATKKGILIKNSKFIEELTRVDTVVFDKTGTITKGDLEVTKVLPLKEGDENILVARASALASASNHPMSRALSRYTADHAIKVAELGDLKEIPGFGVLGYDPLGHIYKFGRREWVVDETCVIPSDFDEKTEGSASYLSADDVLLGCVCFNDSVREDAKSSIEALRSMVGNTVMLTGDRQAAAMAIRNEVGINEVYAKLLPEDKLEKIREIRRNNHNVITVGDGINDALALKESNVGIAMGAMGSDLAIESSDIALMNNNLMNIPFVINLSKKTRKIIYQNMVMSIAISLTMIGLAACGVITPLLGSVLHNIGAFSVLLNSARVLGSKEN